MADEISVVLVDDHTIVRNGLKSLIEVMGNYKVTAEFDNGKAFIDALPLRPEPTVVIMDLNMPEMNGLETVRWLHKHKSPLRILILTLETDERNIIELFRLGVRGYIPKNCSAAVLKSAIEDVAGTGYYHSEMLQSALAHNFGKTSHVQSLIDSITEREMLFIKLVCDQQEFTYEQIANMMSVSPRTVDGYREALFKKLDLKSKTGLVLFAIKHGLIEVVHA
jgi:DNA-binding NarL/FixJ family response regulator